MPDHFDVFLSHNSRDKPAVIQLAKRLKAQGLNVWLDVWELRPGQPWQEALEHIIETTQTAAVLVGADGFGPWQSREMRGCLSEFAENGKVVVPVLLPTCPSEIPKLPFFLKQLTWVDLRDGKEDVGFYNLIWGITGKKPKELDEDDLLIVPEQQGSESKSVTEVGRNKPAPAGVSGKPTDQMPETVAKRPYSGLPPILNSTAEASANTVGNPTVIQLPPTTTKPENREASQVIIPHIHGWPSDKVQALQREAASSLGLSTTFRDKLKAGGEGPLMAVIPAGSYLMGSPADEPERKDSECPQHPVTFARPFAMGVYAVTFDEYDLYCQATGKPLVDDAAWGRRRRPVINVSWHDAQAYCAWLSAQTGMHYRLPSEAEWEYACRAGTVTPFYFGNTITPQQANYDGNYAYNSGVKGEYRGKTVAIDQFQPNPFGLYQMHGNVWEWCEDGWHNNYVGAPDDGSAWVSISDDPLSLRGGAWYSRPRNLRCSSRDGGDPGHRNNNRGFRLARTL